MRYVHLPGAAGDVAFVRGYNEERYAGPAFRNKRGPKS